MYVLDTDTTSHLLDPRRSSTALRQRILSKPLDELGIAIVTVEEILRGALDEVRQAQSRRRGLTTAYAFFQRLHYDLHRFAILPYSEDADRIYNSLDASVRRIGSGDCRIGAIAMAHDCTIVTANTRHFSRIPGLVIEDWTHE